MFRFTFSSFWTLDVTAGSTAAKDNLIAGLPAMEQSMTTQS
jgi:hypothetical protein